MSISLACIDGRLYIGLLLEAVVNVSLPYASENSAGGKFAVRSHGRTPDLAV